MDPTVIMTILEKGSDEQVLMLKELHNAQLSKRNDEMFIEIANHLAGTAHLSSFVELYTQLALAVPEATPATSEAVSISPEEAPEETFEDEDEDVPDEEVIEPQAIEVEDMKVILRTRHTTAVKDGGAIKDHRQDPDWKNAALQYANRLESRMNARIEMRELHNMKDIVSTVMQSTDNTASAVLTAYSVLMQKLNNDERVKYFGSLEKYSNCLQVLNQAQKAVKNILDLKRDEQKISEREKPILENWDWPRLENKVKEYLDQSPAPDSIENVEQFRFVRRLCLLRLTVLDHPPRRLEYFLLKRVPGGEEDNYYKGNTITLNDYKTSSTMGQYSFEISDETRILLDKMCDYWERTRNFSENMYIFGLENQVCSDSFCTKVLQATFYAACKEKISCIILRQLMVDHLAKTGAIRYTTDRKEKARQMAHSPKMQQTVYLKRDVGLMLEDEEPAEEDLSVAGPSVPPPTPKKRKIPLATEPREAKNRARKTYCSEEQQEELKRLINNYEATETFKQKKTIPWTQLRNESEILKDVKPGTLEAWGRRIRKNRQA
ncbi:hypothetical protein HDU85_006549 [Gaertneriomyces sp. JEL0708]|nr:hypothetical protein HDU85_006549 [Gaertneriomyces sp. JEL0708]